ncbi:bifunctional UDP-N-acetylglucosamine pyrophosphorylase / Glucosamine-1-phosphate N-acetyltransferase [Lachnospiraceae bacterium]|nr:bifunctional UDP-N-acetylglucosamine pyrophosphorylase / Glucosamine-1-phosphate N-acetyltransferase [Lachnospiraceae bacterium]
MMDKFKAVILAAGKGTRMESDLPKVLHKVCDQTMVHYVIKAAKDAGATDVIVIVGYQGQLVKREIVDVVDFVEQREQLGTGHAVKCAKDKIGTEGDTVILCGDTPLITAETIRKLREKHKHESNGVTVLSAMVDDPTGYGRIIRDDEGNFLRITEHKDCTEEELKVNEINSGMYVFNSEALSFSLEKITNDNSQGEYYLTDTIQIIKKSGLKVNAMPVNDVDEILGVNTKAQLAEAEKIMLSKVQ